MALRVTRVSISFAFLSVFLLMLRKAFRTKVPVLNGYYFVKIPAVFKALVRRCGLCSRAFRCRNANWGDMASPFI